MAYNIKKESKTNKDMNYNNSSRRFGLLGSLTLNLKPLPRPLLLSLPPPPPPPAPPPLLLRTSKVAVSVLLPLTPPPRSPPKLP